MRVLVVALLLVLAVAVPATSQTAAPKSGGTLNVMLHEDPPQGFSVHESATISVSIQRKLEAVASRPVLAWRLDHFTVWPHVKNLVPHQSIFNFGRMQDVGRDDAR